MTPKPKLSIRAAAATQRASEAISYPVLGYFALFCVTGGFVIVNLPESVQMELAQHPAVMAGAMLNLMIGFFGFFREKAIDATRITTMPPADSQTQASTSVPPNAAIPSEYKPVRDSVAPKGPSDD